MKNMQQKVEEITSFLKNHLEESGLEKYILGVSGGIDSTLTLALAVKAVGEDKVMTYSLPYFEGLDTTDKALTIVQHFHVWKLKTNIKPIVDAFNVNTNIRIGNIMARVRMTILYDKAMSYGGLVLNTCNLSEDLVGYATKFGDAAGDIAPIAHLTKAEVYEMAEYLEIPEHLINRKPSAELWEGQTDEGELGFTYEELDRLIEIYRFSGSQLPLYQWMEESKLSYVSFNSDTWDLIAKKNKQAQHKLKPMPHLDWK